MKALDRQVSRLFNHQHSTTKQKHTYTNTHTHTHTEETEALAVEATRDVKRGRQWQTVKRERKHGCMLKKKKSLARLKAKEVSSGIEVSIGMLAMQEQHSYSPLKLLLLSEALSYCWCTYRKLTRHTTGP